MKPSEALNLYRLAIREIVESNNAHNAKVFGSVLTEDDSESSDLNILVEPTKETTLFDLGAIQYQLRILLGVKVHVLTPNALPENFRAKVASEALPV